MSSSTLYGSVTRWGEGLLLAGLVGGILLVGTLAWVAPETLPFVPVGLIALIGVLLLFRNPRLNFIVWLGGFVILLQREEGLQIHEVLYGLYFYSYLAYWYGQRVLLYRRRLVDGSQDAAALLLLVFGLLGGITLGVLFRADLQRMQGEVFTFSAFALYFPVKEFVTRDRQGLLVVFALIVWMGLYITVENLYFTQRQFATATEVWQISDVRTAGRELILVFSALLLLATLAGVRSRRTQLVLLGLEAITCAGLILTKSRGFWVALAFGIAVLVFLLPGDQRRRLVVVAGGGAFVLIMAAFVVLGPYMVLLVAGVLNRMATLSSTGTDISLLNRFVETAAVREHVFANPILGYGFGTPYSYFRLIEHDTLTWSFIHNSYIAVWYKFGLWGLLLCGFIWIRGIWCALRARQNLLLPLHHRTLATGLAACLICAALPAYTSNMFFEDDKLMAFTLAIATVSGLYERGRRVDPVRSLRPIAS